MIDQTELEWDDVSAAIGSSLRLDDNRTPPVYAKLGEQVFEVTGALRSHTQGRPNQVRVDTPDRTRLKDALPFSQSKLLRPWSEKDYNLYAGFYIPWEWFDAYDIPDEVHDPRA